MTANWPPLATVADAVALGTDRDGFDTEHLLDVASARFRAHTRNPLSPHERTGVLAVSAAAVTLPACPPPLRVLDLRRVNGTGKPGAVVTGWRYDPQQRTVSLATASIPGWLTAGPPDRLHVEWVAGYDPIPDEVRCVVAGMVARATTQSLPGHPPAIFLSGTEQAIADRYRPHP